REVQARQARYIPETDMKSPRRGGWLLRGAWLNLPLDREQNEQGVLVKLDNANGFPPPFGELEELGGETYFAYAGLTVHAVTRKRNWYQYATTVDLIRGLSDPSNDSEKEDIAVFLHNRLL